MVESTLNQKARNAQIALEDREIPNIGEMIDKLSILSRKIYFGEEVAVSEHRYLEHCLTRAGLPGKLITNVIRLTQANIEIWNLEHEMRKCAEGAANASLEEVGRRAIKIRDHNRKRIEYKNIVNDIAGNNFRETKVNHLSGGIAVR